jgi:phosphatidylinositol alpha-1,6-mannosyltransferase
MGILMISWNFPPRRGGMETLLAELSRHLKRRHRLFVITASAPRGHCDEDWILRPARPGLLAFFVYGFFRGLLLLWRNREIDVVLGGSASVAPLIVLLASALRRKSVVYVHGSDLIYRNAFYQLICVRWLKCCDLVIANSRFTAGLAAGKKVAAGSLRVIPPGVDVDRFVLREEVEPKKLFGLEGKKVVLYVGRLAKRKGVAEFVDKALPRIIAEVPEVCFVVVGENPTESLIHHEDVMIDLKNAIQRSGSENHVRLLGWLNERDLVRIYHASDLVILPIRAAGDDVEGFGIVLLEAAAAGRPAIATRTGGIPDAIDDGKSGLLVEPNNYEELSRSVIELLTDRHKRHLLGEHARLRAKEEFSWDKIIARYESGLSDLVARGR